MSAQLGIWVAAHRGELDLAPDVLEGAAADVCVARAMLHRRRAGMARVVTEFFAAVGQEFGPYLAGGVRDVPTDVGREMDEAERAAAAPAGRYADAPAILYERALLAEMAGHGDAALHDLDKLLRAYPGFVRGATQAARLVLARGQPDRAIWRLASVEYEAGHTREGTGVLADALRALGSETNARRYDLAAVTALGHHDSRGNDLPPVDVSGAPLADPRMPLPYSLQWVGNRLLANERGNYYLVASELSSLHLADLVAGRRPPAPVPAQPGVEQFPTPRWFGLAGLATRFGRSAMGRFRRGRGVAVPPLPTVAEQSPVTRPGTADYEILGPADRVRVGRERLQAGLGRIFGQGLAHGAGAVGGPFVREAAGWSGRVNLLPPLWNGASHHLFVDGEHRGPAEFTAEERVLFAERSCQAGELDRMDVVVAPSEIWRLAPPFHHVEGRCWSASLPDLAPIADRPTDGELSNLLLIEDGAILSRPHAVHDDIARLGEGRYSHWGDTLYFSTSDGTDPNRNGRTMSVALTSRPDAVENRLRRHLAIAAHALRKVTPPFNRSKDGWVGFLPHPPNRLAEDELFLLVDALLVGTVALVQEGEVCVGMIGESYEALMSRIIHVFAARQRQIAPPFIHVRDAMWEAPLQEFQRWADSLDEPTRSTLMLREDDRLMPYPHAIHDDIASLGAGRFSHWNETLFFSTSDGSDPNTNGRTYSLLIGGSARDAAEPGAVAP